MPSSFGGIHSESRDKWWMTCLGVHAGFSRESLRYFVIIVVIMIITIIIRAGGGGAKDSAPEAAFFSARFFAR